MFENSVILYGTQTIPAAEGKRQKFENSVILHGTQQLKKSSQTKGRFTDALCAREPSHFRSVRLNMKAFLNALCLSQNKQCLIFFQNHIRRYGKIKSAILLYSHDIYTVFFADIYLLY